MLAKCPKRAKFAPSIVIVTPGLPADTVEGEIEEIDGFGVGGVEVTSKGTELDSFTRVPSMWSQVTTRTWPVPTLAKRAAGKIAVSWELFTNVVGKGVSTLPCDHRTPLSQAP